jgi:hypothetical protein
MVVNVSKTKCIIFHTKGKNVDRNLKLYYDDNEPNNHDQNLIREIDCIYTNCARAYGSGSQCRPNECIFGSGKPRGTGFWVGGYMSQVRETGKSV